jgi:hypothetical protein
MDISFTYIGARMREICTGHHVGLAHTRPCGDELAHRMPCAHHTSFIQEKHFLTNQTPPRVLHKDSSAHHPSKPPPTDPYIGNRLGDPLGSHPDERRRDQSRTHSSADPTLRRFAPLPHLPCVVSPLGAMPTTGVLGEFSHLCPSL